MNETGRGHQIIAAAAVLGALGVMAGAFGAHALDGRVSEARADVFETAVRYHMYHALALLGVGILVYRRVLGYLSAVAASFVVGVLLFSGSLYLLVLLDAPALAIITPFGGVTLIIGWILLAVAAVRAGRDSSTMASEE